MRVNGGSSQRAALKFREIVRSKSGVNIAEGKTPPIGSRT